MVVFGGFAEEGDRVNTMHKLNFKNGEWVFVVYQTE